MRAKGIDISHWQKSYTKKGKVDFIIVKAAEGWGWVDPKFNEFLPEVQKVAVRGAYHYFKTEHDPIMQAQHFYETTEGKGFHFLVVDYEAYNNKLNRKSEAQLKIFWDYLLTLIDVPLLLYTSPFIYRDALCAYNLFWKSVPLWMAHYNGEPVNTGEPETWGTPWLIWQYSMGGTGSTYGVGSSAVDLNVFNGTVEDMEKWIGSEPVITPPEPVREETIKECIAALEELLK